MKSAAEIQAMFAASNDRIAAAVRRLGIEWPAPYLCECPDGRCGEVIRLLLAEYEALRARAQHFAVYPGHLLVGRQQVVERSEHFHIVH